MPIDNHAGCVQTTLQLDHAFLSAFEEFRAIPCHLASEWSYIPFSVPSAFGLAQHPGLALVDRVAALAQQLVHQACPTVSVGVDDKGEIPKEMRPAYLMLAQEGNRSLRYAARLYCLIMSAAFPSSAIWMASIGLYPSSAIVSR